MREPSPLTECAVFQSDFAIAKLPDIHNDPFDRMLITQARSDGLYLLSHDDKVIAYGEPVVKV